MYFETVIRDNTFRIIMSSQLTYHFIIMICPSLSLIILFINFYLPYINVSTIAF